MKHVQLSDHAQDMVNHAVAERERNGGAFAAPGDDEKTWESGLAGERRVAERFSKWFADDWTLLSGYLGWKGEIDQILVGPTGVFAIEIKTLKGTVHCDGEDDWRCEKMVYGTRRVDKIPKSGVGRSPSRQVNDTANALQAVIRSHVGPGWIRRLVVFAGDHVKIGNVRDHHVHGIFVLNDWNLTDLPGHEPSNGPELNAYIVGLISDLHREFVGRTPRREGR